MRTFKGRIQFPNGVSQDVVVQADNQYKATILVKAQYQGARISRSLTEVK
ncbi:hypothetical protein [Moritella sp. F3]|nr:hypothetical protein [Moritella sp. F3]GIC76000.1 hypothetical protein FMO001_07270 [Moritella sp. F1]GIC81539.1 hypothetical protein FMO003_18200 [Moritella sp. F3]